MGVMEGVATSPNGGDAVATLRGRADTPDGGDAVITLRGCRCYILPCLNLDDSMVEINRRPMAVNPSQPNNNVGTCKSVINDNMPRRRSDGTAPDMKSRIFSDIYIRYSSDCERPMSSKN